MPNQVNISYCTLIFGRECEATSFNTGTKKVMSLPFCKGQLQQTSQLVMTIMIYIQCLLVHRNDPTIMV